MLAVETPYIPDFFAYRRRKTREVMVGKVGVGAGNPIRVQSMTTTLTKDVDATVEQIVRLVAAGCEIVRVTTPTPSDARCLGPIKQNLAARDIDVPIVADVHFNPGSALAAAELADKVRVNPGNYADSRRFAVKEYTDSEYAAELARVEERFTPLVLKCRDRGIAMRIGTNHGSLSDRIMNRFGDTPEGMVESALEFVRICEAHGYRNVILSMKASNPKVMIAAYRLLAARMDDLGMDYPFHLGVTEAGNAEDGRIKSAIGIGSLLADGIGDTIRVSLTEEPEAEVPVAFALAAPFQGRRPEADSSFGREVPWDPFHFERRATREVVLGDLKIGGSHPVAVAAVVDDPQSGTAMASVLRWASPAGRRQPKPELAVIRVQSAEEVAALERIAERLSKWSQAQLVLLAASNEPQYLRSALPFTGAVMLTSAGDKSSTPDEQELMVAARAARKALFLSAVVQDGLSMANVEALLDRAESVEREGGELVLSLACEAGTAVHPYRFLTTQAARRGIDAPIFIQLQASSDPLLAEAVDAGSLLCDGMGDALMIAGQDDLTGLSFNILQAAGTRLFKTDYVACPSCGRTLFDLQETTDRIKEKTSHLVGVRLAIMGCIVNGPGEMADADFGYVGGAPGQVNLYVGKQCVEKGVPAEEADLRLIELIKAHGKWEEAEAN